jgi:hypothetical protein
MNNTDNDNNNDNNINTIVNDIFDFNNISFNNDIHNNMSFNHDIQNNSLTINLYGHSPLSQLLSTNMYNNMPDNNTPQNNILHNIFNNMLNNIENNIENNLENNEDTGDNEDIEANDDIEANVTTEDNVETGDNMENIIVNSYKIREIRNRLRRIFDIDISINMIDIKVIQRIQDEHIKYIYECVTRCESDEDFNKIKVYIQLIFKEHILIYDDDHTIINNNIIKDLYNNTNFINKYIDLCSIEELDELILKILENKLISHEEKSKLIINDKILDNIGKYTFHSTGIQNEKKSVLSCIVLTHNNYNIFINKICENNTRISNVIFIINKLLIQNKPHTFTFMNINDYNCSSYKFLILLQRIMFSIYDKLEDTFNLDTIYVYNTNNINEEDIYDIDN